MLLRYRKILVLILSFSSILYWYIMEPVKPRAPFFISINKIVEISRISGLTFTTSTTTAVYKEAEIVPKVRVAEQRLPDVIIAGVKKCGTGAVIEILKLHKNIAAPPYDSTENPLFGNRGWARGVSYFLSKMPKAFPDQLVVTKSQSVVECRPNKNVVFTKLQESQVKESPKHLHKY